MQLKILPTVLFIVVLALASVIIYLVIDSENADNVTTISNTSATNSATETITEQNCVADDCLLVNGLEYPASTLPEAVITALGKAIDDEYKARATYEAVIEKLGSIRPFSMIIRAEEQHISSLKAIYDKYGVAIPADPYNPDTLDIPDTVASSCNLGVDAEIANAALYRDELLSEVSTYPDIVAVFENLMNASQDKHLPAFRKCS
ncbi:MAG: hypothetical protein WCT27_04385 [Patescibacteria group bacterium]|jgi:hypothetical protein